MWNSLSLNTTTWSQILQFQNHISTSCWWLEVEADKLGRVWNIYFTEFSWLHIHVGNTPEWGKLNLKIERNLSTSDSSVSNAKNAHKVWTFAFFSGRESSRGVLVPGLQQEGLDHLDQGQDEDPRREEHSKVRERGETVNPIFPGLFEHISRPVGGGIFSRRNEIILWCIKCTALFQIHSF